MPQVIIAGIAAYVGWITVTQLVLVVAASAYTYDRQRSLRKRARAEFNASLRDRLVQVATVDAARSRIYGRVRVADGVVFKGTHGDKSQHYTLVMALAGHELDGLERVYFNDVPLTLDGSGYVLDAPWSGSAGGSSVASEVTSMAPGLLSTLLPANTVLASIRVVLPGSVGERTAEQVIAHTAELDGGVVIVTPAPGFDDQLRRVTYQTTTSSGGAGSSKARVRFYSGAPGQDLSGVLAPSFPGLITGAHRFAGMACLVVDLEYDQDAFPTGVPAISAVVRGAKVFDPRSGLTQWSENPALCARDWALYAHGGACTAGDLDDASFIAAANACDVAATFNTQPAGFVGPVRPRVLPTYTCGTVARSDQAPDQVLAALVNAMAGRWGWAGGLLRVRAGAYTAPVAELTESWVSDQGDIELVSTLPRTELVNVVNPSIANAEQDYVATPIPRIAPAEYIAADGGVEYPMDMALDAVTDVEHAAHVASVMLREGRQALTVSLTCNHLALPLELFDTLTVTLPRFGWAAKAFEVIGWRYTLEGGIRLTLRETAASLYTVSSVFERDDAAPNTALPNPWAVPALSIAALQSGTDQLLRQADGTLVSRIKVTWAAVQDEAVRNGGAIEIRYGRVSQAVADWATVTVPGTETRAYLPGVQDGAAYAVSIRARNKLVGGAWSLQQVHVVVGKEGGPAAVTDLAALQLDDGVLLLWAPNTQPDYAATELALIPPELVGTAWAWSELTPLWRGHADAYALGLQPAGEHHYAARHVDTSGQTGPIATTSVDVLVGGAGLVTLRATALAFSFDGANTATPPAQTITLTAYSSGLTGDHEWTATLYDATGASLGAATLGGSPTGAVRTLAVADFGAAASCRVWVTRGASGDTTTLVRLRDGASVLSGYLTNEVHSVATASDGSGGSYGSAGGVFRVFRGLDELTGTGQVAYSVHSSSGISGMSIHATSGAYSLSGTTSDVGVAELRATVGAVVLSKTYSIVRSRAGSPGAAGPQGPDGSPGAPGSPGSPGANGRRTATVRVYKWAASVPAGPVGSSIYTWASGTLDTAPANWFLAPPEPTLGWTLYAAEVVLSNTDTGATDTVSWVAAGIVPIGSAGPQGQAGAGARMAYTVLSSGSSLGSGTRTSTGTASLPANNAWGGGETWSATAPAYGANQTVWQTSGTYNPATDTTTWDTPYISALKVGSLSAISANLGTITAGSLDIGAGRYQVSSSGYLVARGVQVLDEAGNVVLSTAAGAIASLPASWVTPAPGWLNSNVTLAGLGFTGDPAATRNRVYRQDAPAPAGADGDIWVRTDTTPNYIYVWLGGPGGGWNVSANLTSNTNELVDGAGLGQTANWAQIANLPNFGAFALINQITAANVSTYIAGAAIDIANIKLASIVNLAALNAYTGQLTVDGSGHIKGGATGYATGTGFWIGNDGGTYKFRIGSSSQYMRWTGSALELKLDLMTASVSGGDLSVGVSNGNNLAYGSRSVSVSGGTAPYSYAWVMAYAGSDIPGRGEAFITGGANTATVGVGGSGSNSVTYGALSCVVTDANGRTASAGFNFTATHGTPS